MVNETAVDMRLQSDCPETVAASVQRLPTQRTVRWILTWLLAAGMHAALAQGIESKVPALPAAGSIHSVEMADQALQDAALERQQLEAGYLAEQYLCYDRFFVSRCLAQAAERHRLALNRIRPVEVEANAYKRRAKVDERDANLAQQRVRDQQDAAQRAAQQREAAISAQQKMERGARDAQAAQANQKLHEGAADRRVAEHNARLQQIQQEEAAGAGERARNVADFEKKRQEAATRQREVAAKKAEKERQRAQVPAVPGVPSAPSPAADSKP